ncbi:hypothetical protein B0T16DRAFT_449377 [Cercophora newfieldiana]|uniref:DUF7907 domain-containing protein n=1 Tax=Cercophora newfieldiana TaxID=92897 RepID=A0AA40CKS5_9PEZI|nr:hypothetical protein B0T16DRAFT_449377 [Cercophora newfieldiana]
MHTPTLLTLTLSLCPLLATASPLPRGAPTSTLTSKAFRLILNSTNPSHSLHPSIHGFSLINARTRALSARAVVDDWDPLTWFQHPDTGCTDLSKPGSYITGSMILTTAGDGITGLQRGFEGIGPKYDITMNGGQLGTRGLALKKGSAVVDSWGGHAFVVCRETYATKYGGNPEALTLNVLEFTGEGKFSSVLRPTENCTPVNLVAECDRFGSMQSEGMWEEEGVKEYVERAEETTIVVTGP